MIKIFPSRWILLNVFIIQFANCIQMNIVIFLSKCFKCSTQSWTIHYYINPSYSTRKTQLSHINFSIRNIIPSQPITFVLAISAFISLMQRQPNLMSSWSTVSKFQSVSQLFPIRKYKVLMPQCMMNISPSFIMLRGPVYHRYRTLQDHHSLHLPQQEQLLLLFHWLVHELLQP